MRKALQIARLIGCWALILGGVLLAAFFTIGLFVSDEPNRLWAALFLYAFAAGMIFFGVRWLRKRPESEPALPEPEPFSPGANEALARLQRGETIVLHPRRWRWALLLVILGAFTWGCAAWFSAAPGILPAAGVLLFGAGAVLSITQFFPRWAYLRIGPDGLVLRHALRTTRWSWNDIDDFVAYEIQHQYNSTKHVGFNRRDLTPDRQSFWQTITRGLSGVDGALPDTYGMRHDELAALLNEARDRYATVHGPSPSLLADLELQRQADAIPRDRLPVVTVALAVTCLVVYVMMVDAYGLIPDASELRSAGGASRDALADGDWWTLLTANVLHATPWHLFLNLIALLIIGVLLEREVGWARFAVLCLVAGVAAMGLGVLLQIGAGVVGVSGIVYGIATWAVVRDLHRTRALGIVAWSILPIGLIYTFLVPGISIGAHLGGLLAGLAIGRLFERGLARRREPAIAG
jgi:membrane associated rhomboid family serine protease